MSDSGNLLLVGLIDSQNLGDSAIYSTTRRKIEDILKDSDCEIEMRSLDISNKAMMPENKIGVFCFKAIRKAGRCL